MAALATEYFLYALLLVQPILGILHSDAVGTRVGFDFLGGLPAIVGRDKVLAEQTIAAHDLVANLLLVVIALHTAAALFHHFVRRDDVMNAMLPARRA
jgi:cytochrome b561